MTATFHTTTDAASERRVADGNGGAIAPSASALRAAPAIHAA